MTTKRAKAAGRVTRDVLLDAALPEATKTYTVISHSFVINTIKKTLADHGFNVVNEIYSATEGGQLAYGAFHINYGDDPDLGMLFAFGNSYNKEMKFSCSVGAYVRTNETSILSEGGQAWIRKHTGNADDLAAEVIEQQIGKASLYFAQLQSDKDVMKNIILSKKQYAELLGVLFVDRKIIGHAQLGLIKKEFEKPSFKYQGDPMSLWNLYNHILLGLAKSHPRTWMEQQKQVHLHMVTEFDLTTFDDEEVVEDQTQFEGDTELGEEISPEIEEVITEHSSVENDTEALPPNTLQQVDPETGEKIGEPINLDHEEDQDWEDLEAKGIITPVNPEADEISQENLEAAAEKYDEVVAEAKAEEPVAETPPAPAPERPKMKVSEALEKFGHVLTEEERSDLENNIMNQGAVDKLRVEAEHEFANQNLKEVVEEQVEKVVNEEYQKSATDGKTQLPLTEEKLAELNKKVDQGAILPQAPQQSLPVNPTAESQIETPQEEGEDLSALKEHEAEFFMTKSDLTEMFDGVELEKGLVLTIGDEECEILDFTVDEADNSEMVCLVPISAPEVTEEELSEQLHGVNNNEEAITMTTKIDKAMEIMNSKKEMTPEELAVHEAIEKEVADLYGTKLPFTYKLSGDQYTVQLESGESFVLASIYVDSLIQEA
jgi:hypothetical protein